MNISFHFFGYISSCLTYCLVIQLFIYGGRQVWYLLVFHSQKQNSPVNYFQVQIVLDLVSGALSNKLFCPFDIAQFFEHFLSLWYDVLGSSCIFPVPTQNQPFSPEAWLVPFNRKWYLEIKIWGTSILVSNWVLSSGPSLPPSLGRLQTLAIGSRPPCRNVFFA